MTAKEKLEKFKRETSSALRKRTEDFAEDLLIHQYLDSLDKEKLSPNNQKKYKELIKGLH